MEYIWKDTLYTTKGQRIIIYSALYFLLIIFVGFSIFNIIEGELNRLKNWYPMFGTPILIFLIIYLPFISNKGPKISSKGMEIFSFIRYILFPKEDMQEIRLGMIKDINKIARLYPYLIPLTIILNPVTALRFRHIFRYSIYIKTKNKSRLVYINDWQNFITAAKKIGINFRKEGNIWIYKR